MNTQTAFHNHRLRRQRIAGSITSLTVVTISALVSCSIQTGPSPLEPNEVPVLAGTRVTSVNPIASIDLSNDGESLVLGGVYGVSHFRMQPDLEQSWNQPLDGIEYVRFSHDNQQIVIVEDSGLVILVDSQSGQIINGVNLASQFIPTSATLSPQEDRLAIGTWGGAVLIWDVLADQLLYTWDDQVQQHRGAPQHTIVEWFSDGRLIAAGGWFREIIIWDAITGNLVEEFTNHFEVSNIDVSPDGTLIAANSHDNHFAIWDVATGRLLSEWQAQPPPSGASGGPTLGLAWSADGSYLAGSTDDGTIEVWDSTDFSITHTIRPDQAHGLAIHTIRWSPDNRVLYLGSYAGTVIIWDIIENQLINIVTAPPPP